MHKVLFKFSNMLKSEWMTIYTPPLGLSSLAKELSAAASVMQSSLKELSTLVADKV